MTKEMLNAQRNKRLDDAIALKEPDRVPFMPKMSGFYMYGYDISYYDVMKDARNMERGVRSFIREYEPDAVNLAALYGIDALEALDTTFLRWPGPTCGLPLDASFQHLDATYLEDEEYEEFIMDPTHVMLTKLLPRKYKRLKGLSKLYFRQVYDPIFFSDLGVFTDPEVIDALEALKEAGKANARRAKQMDEVRSWVADEGYSTWCQGSMCIPFDAFGDCARGIIQIALDCVEFPDELEAAVNKLTVMNVERVLKLYASRGAKRVFFPLHCGVDDFMSLKNYERFYWPNLKYCIEKALELGMTPVCFCEGRYNSRLEFLCDVPKGKVVYMFENVDLQRAKDTVGKVACICGTVPNALLAFGTREQVINETKRQIDILAPGGGFIMDCSMMLDNATHENMRAWRETTLEYGKY